MSSISDQLRQAIQTAPVTRYRMSVDTGIAESMLSRFVNGQRGLDLSTVNVLGRYLGLRLVQAGKMKGRSK